MVKENLLQAINSFKYMNTRDLWRYVTEIQFELVSDDKMRQIAGEYEVLCVIGGKCWYTDTFASLPLYYQVLYFLMDINYSIHYLINKCDGSMYWVLAKEHELPMNITHNNTLKTIMSILNIVGCRFEPVPRHISRNERQSTFIAYTSQYVNEWCEDYCLGYTQDDMQLMLNTMPTITIEKAKSYYSEIFSCENSLVGKVKHYLEAVGVCEGHVTQMCRSFFIRKVTTDTGIRNTFPFFSESSTPMRSWCVYDLKERRPLMSKDSAYKRFKNATKVVRELSV